MVSTIADWLEIVDSPCKSPSIIADPSATLWQAPISGLLKLNVDGAIFDDMGAIGFGAILRDADGRPVSGFSEQVKGCLDHTFVELLAVRLALHNLLAIGHLRFLIEVDCLTIAIT